MSLPIGFFTPLPLPIMIPFMFAQSAAMALAFGSNFQYGKRKISSMSNEEFNELSPLDMNNELAASINAMIPTVEESFKHFESMNVTILNSMARYFAQAIEFGFDVLTGKQAIQGSGSTFSVGNIPENIASLFPSFPEASAEVGGAAKTQPPVISTGPTGPTNIAIDFSKLSWEHLQRINPLKDLKTSQDRANWLKWYNIRKPKPGKTPEQAITDSGATGETKQIATLYNNMQQFFNEYVRQYNKQFTQTTTTAKLTVDANMKKYLKLFLAAASKYNIYVAGIRKPNLQIDQAKSIKNRRLTPK